MGTCCSFPEESLRCVVATIANAPTLTMYLPEYAPYFEIFENGSGTKIATLIAIANNEQEEFFESGESQMRYNAVALRCLTNYIDGFWGATLSHYCKLRGKSRDTVYAQMAKLLAQTYLELLQIHKAVLKSTY